MQIKLFTAILIFAVFFEEATALKCYGCLSSKSWSSCNDVKKEFTCSPGIKHCLKEEISIKGSGVDQTHYARRCSDDCNKETRDDCKEKKGFTTSCKISCCTTDLCNTGSVPLVSGFIIMACALVFALF